MKKIIIFLSIITLIISCSSNETSSTSNTGTGGYTITSSSGMDIGSGGGQGGFDGGTGGIEEKFCSQLGEPCAVNDDSMSSIPGVCISNNICSTCGTGVEVGDIIYKDDSTCIKCLLNKNYPNFAHGNKISVTDCQ